MKKKRQTGIVSRNCTEWLHLKANGVTNEIKTSKNRGTSGYQNE